MNNGRNRILVVTFANDLPAHDLPLFRGAVIDTVGREHVLFHNHEGDKLRYRYPLVQYKRIGGKAALVCVGEGADVVGEFFANNTAPLQIGDRSETFAVQRVVPHNVLTQIWQSMFTYTIRKYLPLNQENYQRYMAMDSLAEQYALLERCLTGNILSFAKSLGIHFDETVVVRISQVLGTKTYRYKNVRLQGFDLVFKTNVSLPDYIGLGKSVSLGFGTVCRTDRH